MHLSWVRVIAKVYRGLVIGVEPKIFLSRSLVSHAKKVQLVVIMQLIQQCVGRRKLKKKKKKKQKKKKKKKRKKKG